MFRSALEAAPEHSELHFGYASFLHQFARGPQLRSEAQRHFATARALLARDQAANRERALSEASLASARAALAAGSPLAALLAARRAYRYRRGSQAQSPGQSGVGTPSGRQDPGPESNWAGTGSRRSESSAVGDPRSRAQGAIAGRVADGGQKESERSPYCLPPPCLAVVRSAVPFRRDRSLATQDSIPDLSEEQRKRPGTEVPGLSIGPDQIRTESLGDSYFQDRRTPRR